MNPLRHLKFSPFCYGMPPERRNRMKYLTCKEGDKYKQALVSPQSARITAEHLLQTSHMNRLKIHCRAGCTLPPPPNQSNKMLKAQRLIYSVTSLIDYFNICSLQILPNWKTLGHTLVHCRKKRTGKWVRREKTNSLTSERL